MQLRFAPAEAQVEWTQVSFEWGRQQEGRTQ
jgi:hypothetical protein